MHNLKKFITVFMAALLAMTSMARAEYVHNDPINNKDPNGQQAVPGMAPEFVLPPAGMDPMKAARLQTQTGVYGGLGGLAGAGISAGGLGLAALGLEGSGLLALDIIAGESLGPAGVAGLGGGGTALFRAVDGTELADIVRNGFRLGPNGAEVKAFVGSPKEAQALATAYGDATGEAYSVVRGDAPQSVIEGAERYTFTDVPGQSMDAIAIRGQEQLDQVKFSTCYASRIDGGC